MFHAAVTQDGWSSGRHTRHGVLASRLAESVSRALGDTVTTRNRATMLYHRA
jgi:hypothetical protein